VLGVAALVPAFVALSLALLLLVSHEAVGQAGGGGAPHDRLKEEIPNEYRSGNPKDVKKEMEKLFDKILIKDSDDGKVDKWYSPHLRDMRIQGEKVRDPEVWVRANARPIDDIGALCKNGFPPPVKNACPLCDPNGWHGEPYSPHQPLTCCYGPSTKAYEKLKEDWNFKACCVREAEAEWSSEMIACAHPDGKGWAGMFEYYFPTSALGWENDRTTTLIVDKENVKKCLKEADPLMKGAKAVDWVTGAIKRNMDMAAKLGGGGGASNEADLKAKVQDSIKTRDKIEEKLRFADSLQGEGLTLRVNLAAMDVKHRELLAKRFCMHKDQFGKLMDQAAGDELQLKGGRDWTDLNKVENVKIWSNYCKEGVELMLDPKKSALKNIDGTPTDYKKGMAIWEKDPMFCQRMNLENPNMDKTKIGDVIRKSGNGQYDEKKVGYTCREGGKLNGSLVPVTFYRHAAVERRAAISDHALGFLIAGGLAPGMIQGKRSYYKRFEPQPYSMNSVPYDYETFIGKQWKGFGGKINEQGEKCKDTSGENYAYKNKSDQLYISNVTHQVFTQDPVNDADGKGEFNRYVQEWAQDPEKTAKDISERWLDDKSSNYAAAFRIFATCPKGYVRWRPPEDHDSKGLMANLAKRCREENFGGPTRDE
jgi:hypothetical protein